jgi:hypothetical protein
VGGLSVSGISSTHVSVCPVNILVRTLIAQQEADAAQSQQVQQSKSGKGSSAAVNAGQSSIIPLAQANVRRQGITVNVQQQPPTEGELQAYAAATPAPVPPSPVAAAAVSTAVPASLTMPLRRSTPSPTSMSVGLLRKSGPVHRPLSVTPEHRHHAGTIGAAAACTTSAALAGASTAVPPIPIQRSDIHPQHTIPATLVHRKRRMEEGSSVEPASSTAAAAIVPAIRSSSISPTEHQHKRARVTDRHSPHLEGVTSENIQMQSPPAPIRSAGVRASGRVASPTAPPQLSRHRGNATTLHSPPSPTPSLGSQVSRASSTAYRSLAQSLETGKTLCAPVRPRHFSMGGLITSHSSNQTRGQMIREENRVAQTQKLQLTHPHLQAAMHSQHRSGVPVTPTVHSNNTIPPTNALHSTGRHGMAYLQRAQRQMQEQRLRSEQANERSISAITHSAVPPAAATYAANNSTDTYATYDAPTSPPRMWSTIPAFSASSTMLSSVPVDAILLTPPRTNSIHTPQVPNKRHSRPPSRTRRTPIHSHSENDTDTAIHASSHVDSAQPSAQTAPLPFIEFHARDEPTCEKK